MRTLICVVGCAFLLFFHPSQAQAQCDCDFIIPASAYAVDGATLKGVNGQIGVKPGDKVCFANGTRIDVMMTNFIGTAANPILITNMCDGQVRIQGASAAAGRLMYMGNCKFVRVSGSGNPSVPYGIEMTVGVQGIDFRDLSTNVEADHLYIHDIGYSALNAKTDPTCDSKTWRGNFTMRDVWIHDNKVSNIGGEGVYIGESHYHTTVPVSCNGTTIQAQEHETIGCKVYNNIFTNIGRDGIQVGAVTSGGEIHHNKITNFGTTNEYGQQSGIQINPGTNAEVYNNVVDTGTGFGLFAGGRGGSHVYNNIIANCLQGGIICADYAPVDPSGFIFSNNTLINNKVYGIYMLSEATSQNQFVNNIIVGTTESGYQYVKLNSPKVKWTESNNIKTTDISSVKFVNSAAKDWHLQTASTAKDAGKDMRSYGVTKDLDDTARPQGAALDLGAYEVKASGSNAAPVAKAGADKTITLPTSTTTLTGSGTDADGTVASYAWAKVAGGTVTLANATSATLNLSALLAGTYTFRLTVKDNAGASATDDVIVTVKAAGATANKAPVANAGADKTITLPTNALNIAGGATDSDGIVMYWEWTKVSGGAATLTDVGKSTLKLSGLVAGTYVFRLKVTDNLGAVATDDVTVTVKAAAAAAPPAGNAIPTVGAGVDKTIKLPTNSLNIAGSATDSDGTILYWEWTKVSGGAATLADAGKSTLKLTGLAAGTYVFRLKVTDNLGAWKSDDVTVTVNAAGTTARAATADNYEAAADSTDIADESYAPQTSEDEFVIMDKHFPGGHRYAIVVFDANGTRVYAGEWSADRFSEIFKPGQMYIYHVIQDGMKIDMGKVAVGR